MFQCEHRDHGCECLLTGFKCKFFDKEEQCPYSEPDLEENDDDWVDSDFPLSEEK